MTCKRCGAETPRHTLTQRYCPTCAREVERPTARPAEDRRPAWLRNATFRRDLTGGLA